MSKYKILLKYVSSVLIGTYFLLHILSGKKVVSASEYFYGEIYGRIDTIYSYQKTLPVVSINGLNQLLDVPYECAKYIRKGDIINKNKATLVLTTYRKNNYYIEVYKWGYITNDSLSSGIISKRIKFE